MSETEPPLTPRSRKRIANSPLQELDVGSAHTNPYINNNPSRSTHSASITGSVHEEEDALLHLRKQYHHTLTAITKAEHHRSFLKQCQQENRVPKGLQIKLTPQAYMSDSTTINTEFNNITRQAEQNLCDTLIRHYDTLHEKLTAQLNEIEEKMAETAASESETTIETHEALIQKTIANIHKRKSTLQEKATKKIEILKNPQRRPHPPGNRRNPPPATQRRQRNPPPTQQRRPHPPPRTETRTTISRERTEQRDIYPSYAAATKGFQARGPGLTESRHQEPRIQRKTLLPLPTMSRGTDPTGQDTQKLILQTLAQLLQILQQ